MKVFLMKKIVLILAAMIAFSCTPAMATQQCDWHWFQKGMCPGQQQQGVDLDLSLKNYNKLYSTNLSKSQAEANSAAWSKAVSESEANSASKSGVYDSGNSSNVNKLRAEGGTGIGIGVGGGGGDSDSFAKQGQQLNAGDILISGDSINYEVAANKRTIIASGCQESTAADSIKYGVAVVKQSAACLLLTTSTDALIFAAAMDCGDYTESVVKGASAVNPSQCLRTRSSLVQRALDERQMAVDIITRDAKRGVLNKAFNWIW